MKYIFSFLLILIAGTSKVHSQQHNLPDSIYSGPQGNFHVQGVVVDHANGYVYFSFTDRLVKTDLAGKMIGSVTGFVGHLGDLDIAPDGKVYGSLEYKNDAIGKGIQEKLGAKARLEDGFYIAIFDVALITCKNMKAEAEGLLKTVFLKEATDDYNAKVTINGRKEMHRFACSGIDGVAFAPAIGNKSSSGKKYLYVAYGIYGDTNRDDNDQQVILKYDVGDWSAYATNLSQQSLHHSGPKKPMEKYFLRTGNTKYGIQNLAYDTHSGHLFAAVYRGSKPDFPNYDLFVIDSSKKPFEALIRSDGDSVSVKMLSLLDAGQNHLATGIRGWNFPFGATGLCPLGDGTFYISQPAKAKDGDQESTLFRYKWLGDDSKGFELIHP
ncbi:MAG: hypothetical protein EOO89_05790 [Pedobacter sp.]|nr:MAG: hypothetical protein EOO89_05790 [Pedobacter sp.]